METKKKKERKKERKNEFADVKLSECTSNRVQAKSGSSERGCSSKGSLSVFFCCCCFCFFFLLFHWTELTSGWFFLLCKIFRSMDTPSSLAVVCWCWRIADVLGVNRSVEMEPAFHFGLKLWAVSSKVLWRVAVIDTQNLRKSTLVSWVAVFFQCSTSD